MAITLDQTFSALGDPTRRAIVQRLAKGEATVKELARPFQVSLPAISKHLRILEEAGLLVRKIEGRIHRCHLGIDPLRQVERWIEEYTEFWEGQLNSLDQYLQKVSSTSKNKEEVSWQKPPRPQLKVSRFPVPLRRVPKSSSTHGRTRKR